MLGDPLSLPSLIESVTSGFASGIGRIEDPYERARVLEEKIRVGILEQRSVSYIQGLQAKLDAAYREIKLAEQGEQDWRTAVTLGQIGTVLGIGVAGAIVYYIVRKA